MCVCVCEVMRFVLLWLKRQLLRRCLKAVVLDAIENLENTIQTMNGMHDLEV